MTRRMVGMVGGGILGLAGNPRDSASGGGTRAVALKLRGFDAAPFWAVGRSLDRSVGVCCAKSSWPPRDVDLALYTLGGQAPVQLSEAHDFVACYLRGVCFR